MVGPTESRIPATVFRERLLIMGTTSMTWLGCKEPVPTGAIAWPFGASMHDRGGKHLLSMV